jgi:uncharacterized protein
LKIDWDMGGGGFLKGMQVDNDSELEIVYVNRGKAAEQGNTRAQNNLGVLYIKGDGIPRDREKAISWWKKAAKNGNITAKNNSKKIGESW